MRFYQYYNYEHLSKGGMTIYKALLKYGYSNFKLEILEYCAPEDAIKREQHYLDTLCPEYNILKVAGSSLGYNHTEATLAKLRERRHSEETKAKLRSYRHEVSEETRAKISSILKGIGGIKVWVTNIETRESIEYASLSDAAQAVGVSHHTIKKYLITGAILKKIYLVGANKDMALPESTFRKSNNSAATSIVVTNVNTGEKLEYASIYAASKELGITRPTLKSYLITGKCLKNTYIIQHKCDTT
jgi:group I intron endonuclease